MTYACPHMIIPAAVAGSPIEVRTGVRMKVATPPATTPLQQPVAVPSYPEPKPAVKPDFLIFKDETWRAAQTLSPEDMHAEISDATLLSQPTPEGNREWEVSAPITFQYRVREEPNVFDLSSDALVFGHITNADDLARAKSRPLKRVVVVDDAIYSLYGERIDAYFAHHDVTTKLLVLPTTEENKNMEMVLTIAEAIHELGVDR